MEIRTPRKNKVLACAALVFMRPVLAYVKVFRAVATMRSFAGTEARDERSMASPWVQQRAHHLHGPDIGVLMHTWC